MVCIRSLLCCIVLAGSSSAFAISQDSKKTFATLSTSSSRRPDATRTALSMSSGGSSVTLAPELKPPAALYEGAVVAGTAKALAPFWKIFKLGIVSGCHIGFGSYLAITVGGACPGIAAANPGLQKIIFGAFGLPFGLIMTIVTGGELFTGNTAMVTSAWAERQITLKDLWKNWAASYTGNLIGSLLLAWLAFQSGTLGTAPAAVAIATGKCSLPWKVAFVRGLLCNWLVCMAVYMASGCSTMIGKMIAVFFPISAFTALGLDHSVANMFIIPLGIFRGADISWTQMWFNNLIPVTLGNIVGGALCVMAPFGTSYGKWFAKKDS